MSIKRILVAVLCIVFVFSATVLAAQPASIVAYKDADGQFVYRDKDKEDEKADKEKDLFKGILQTKVKDGKLTAVFSLINMSGRWLPITFEANNAYEFIIEDSSGNRVWSTSGSWKERSSKEMGWMKRYLPFTSPMILLKPGKSKQIQFTQEWEFKKQGIASGKYKVKVKMHPMFVGYFSKMDKSFEVEVEKQISIETNSSVPVQSARLDTLLNTRLVNGGLEMNFGYKNISNQTLNLTFPTGQLYEIRIWSSSGAEVYKWSDDRMFTQALVNQSLSAGEVKSYTETWNLTDKSGARVPGGTYTVEVKTLAQPADGKTSFGINEVTETQRVTIPGQTVSQYLQVVVDPQLRNGTMDINFSLNNVSGRGLDLEFPTTQTYEIEVFDPNHNRVYQWSQGMMFGQMVTSMHLNAGQSKGYDEVWDLTQNGQTVAPVGEYTVRVTFRARPAGGTGAYIQNEIMAEKKIRIDAADKNQSLVTTLDADLEDNQLHMDFALRNIFTSQLQLQYGSSQKYDIVITDELGREVYRWSEGKKFTEGILWETLPSGEQQTFNETWNLINKDDKKALPGKYQVRVEMKAYPITWVNTFNPRQLIAVDEFVVSEENMDQRLSTVMNIDQKEDRVDINFFLFNLADQDIQLRFNSGQRYDIVVTNAKGQEVYRWSHDQFFTLSTEHVTIQKGSLLSFPQMTWNFRDNDGYRVPNGVYDIRVEIKAFPETWGEAFEPEALTDVESITLK